MKTEVIEHCINAALKDEMTFPESVKNMMEAGVERYYVDLITLKGLYYSSSNEFYEEKINLDLKKIGNNFDEEEVVAAIKSIQRQEIDYPEFLRRILENGCIAYAAYLAGKEVAYYGRKGETYVEKFPGSLN